MHLRWLRNLSLVKRLRGRHHAPTGDHADESTPPTSVFTESVKAQDDPPGYEDPAGFKPGNMAFPTQGLTQEFALQFLQQQRQYSLQSEQIAIKPFEQERQQQFKLELRQKRHQFERQLLQQEDQLERQLPKRPSQHFVKQQQQHNQTLLQLLQSQH
ncbi:hypothetical protein PG996_008394 [Apiospora saccharicola]|uniref:Uncharacterized protein n=1 Tax=Apiospora saccharicola TaxID=335842 RepID=A0ABR1UYH1_9PEZI